MSIVFYAETILIYPFSLMSPTKGIQS